MLYQKILMDEAPYQLRVGAFRAFEEHRHADIEFNYCARGSFEIEIDKKMYRVKEGELALIGPMISHRIPEPKGADHLALTVVVGPTFLKKQFGYFSKASFSAPICSLAEPTEDHRHLRELFRESIDLYRTSSPHSDLLLTGNLYKICAYLLRERSAPPSDASENRDLRRVANIEKALELIHYDYAKPLTVEMAAAATGYGKSNFCKIFKDVVGDSFHCVLNRCRVQNAYGLLSETDMPVSAIAQEVGFGETKTFCRVFKSVAGVTPGTYRAQSSSRQR